MKIGINLLLWTTFVTEAHFPLMEALRETGYDGIEIPLGRGGRSHYAKIGRELDQLGLDCTTVTSVHAESNPISPDAKIRAAAVEQLKWAIEMTATLGGEVMCGPFHSAFKTFSGSPPTEEEAKWGAEVMYQAAEFANANGVTLAVEALNRFECYFLNTIAMARTFVERVGHPSCRIIYDTHHSHIEEKSPAAAIALCADMLAHVHISENDRGTPGTGQVNWAENFAALKKIGYDKWLTIEAFSTADPEFASGINVWRNFANSPEDVYRDGLKFIQNMWQRA